jgi:hypothetical protein
VSFQLLLLFGDCLFIVCSICLCVDIVPVLSELPLESDQEEPVFEGQYTQLIEEGKWLSPSAFSLLNL